jgi:radical SAM superfamily enzyme YgiQ (UPF0313 family)
MKHLMSEGTKCLLVGPKFSDYHFLNYSEICKFKSAKYPVSPLGLMTAAALLPQNWQFKLIDENVETLKNEHFEWADLICTGGMLSQQARVHAIIDKAHEYERPVVVGGPDATSQPHLYQSADYLVLGEGENTIPHFLKDLENGCRSGQYRSSEKADLNNSVVPRFDLIRFKDYTQVAVQFSRGCPFNCEICDVSVFFGKKFQMKGSGQIIKELQALYDAGYRGSIFLADDNFTANKNSAKQTLPVIREWSKAHNHPFFFGSQCSVDLVDDEDLMRLMRDVDFRWVVIGIETPEDEILRSIKKKQNIKRQYRHISKKLLSYGMIVHVTLILGFDNENDRTADRMIKTIEDIGAPVEYIGLLEALPNTQFTKRLEREGRLLGESLIQKNPVFDKMTSGLNFITKRPKAEILNDYIKVLSIAYRPKNYYKRATYMAMNLKPAYKYIPSTREILKMVRTALRVCLAVGFDKITGVHFWKMLFILLVKNPIGILIALEFSAYYIHFYKQSKFLIDFTNRRI